MVNTFQQKVSTWAGGYMQEDLNSETSESEEDRSSSSHWWTGESIECRLQREIINLIALKCSKRFSIRDRNADGEVVEVLWIGETSETRTNRTNRQNRPTNYISGTLKPWPDALLVRETAPEY